MVCKIPACPLLAARLLLALTFLGWPIMAAAQSPIDAGRGLFLDERKGNCAACHKVPGDSLVRSIATVGPALEGIKARYPDRKLLRDLIWDPLKTLPDTIMPAYGRHHILSESEIFALVLYLETL
jgi:sulfur-oxidizing protein SoxX